MNIYEKLGVKQYINAAATLTMYGGSIMSDEVIAAMKEASKSYIDIVDLHKKAGECIAKMTRNEAAFVPNGAAAGMMLATAAAIAGDDMDARAKLPFSDGMKNEVIISQAGRVGYDYAIKMAGGKYVTYGDDNKGTAEQLEAAITNKTAAIFVFYFEHLMDNQPSFEAQVKIAKAHGIPLFVDAAAQLPMKENLWRYTQEGADLAIFSGGKGLRGPQASGLIVGKKCWVDKIRSIASPNPGLGRPMKVGKEEIIGLMTAIKLYMEHDENTLLASYENQVNDVIKAFKNVSSVEVDRSFPSEAGQPMPRAQVTLKAGAFKVDAEAIGAQLKAGSPGILVAANKNKNTIQINPQTLLEGEMDIIIDKLKEVLEVNRL